MNEHRPNHQTRVTRSRKGRTSFVASTGEQWTTIVGDPGAPDPVVPGMALLNGRDVRQSIAVTGSTTDDAHGVTRESRLVHDADAWLARSEGQRIVSPQGNATEWNDDHKLGGLMLTDRPWERSARSRAMRPSVFGGRDYRGLADSTYVDPETWCDEHQCEQGVCGCQHVSHASIGQCSRHRTELAVDAGEYGFSGETVVSDANRVRSSIGAPSRSAVFDHVDVLHESANGRKVRGVTEPCVTVIYSDGQRRPVDPITHHHAPDAEPTATVHDAGKVVRLLGWVERTDEDGTHRVPMLGHERLTIERKRSQPTTRQARDEARNAALRLVDRREALALELAALLAPLAVGQSVDHETAGLCTRTRRDRYQVAQWSAGSPAMVAVRAARELIPT